MPSDSPSPLEMQLDALAALYGVSPEAVIDIAVRNLAAMAACQLGKEGASAEQVFGLLLAPAPALRRPQGAQGAPPGWPDPEGPPPPRAGPHHRAVIRAASKMSQPFTSRELAPSAGVSSAVAGGILGAVGWPAEPAQVGQEKRWLPRPG